MAEALKAEGNKAFAAKDFKLAAYVTWWEPLDSR